MLINKLINNKNDIIKIVYTSIISYFTFWVLILNFGYHIGTLKKYQFSIFLLTILVSFGGFILTYIHPKKFIVPVINYKLTYLECQVIDIIFHNLPLLILLMVYDYSIKNDSLIFFFIVILLYLLINNPIELYHI